MIRNISLVFKKFFLEINSKFSQNFSNLFHNLYKIPLKTLQKVAKLKKNHLNVPLLFLLTTLSFQFPKSCPLYLNIIPIFSLHLSWNHWSMTQQRPTFTYQLHTNCLLPSTDTQLQLDAFSPST